MRYSFCSIKMSIFGIDQVGLKLHFLFNVSQYRNEIFNCLLNHTITTTVIIAGSLESAYSLIWGSHKISGKGGGDTLDFL